MAVQAQYPSNALLFNRSEQERKEMDYSQNPNGCLDQPSIFFNNGVNVVQRKRGRESSFQTVPTPPQMNLFSLQSHHHHHHHPSLVSTGLHLSSFDDDSNQTQNLTSLIKQQEIEFDQYLFAQGEQLRRTLVEKTQAHYRALLLAAEETAARRLKEKEFELNRAVKRTAELETRIARIRNEALTWQAKASSNQATAAALHAQIQQVQLAMANNRAAEECLSDAGSAHVDPNRVEDTWRACRVCGVSEVSVVLIPCRHLCLCLECDGAGGDSDAVRCPVCHAVRAGSVQVLFS